MNSFLLMQKLPYFVLSEWNSLDLDNQQKSGMKKEKVCMKDVMARVELYLFDPTSQNIEPSTKAQNVVKRNLTALYCGDLQYTTNCFLRQSQNCDMIC